MALWPRKTKSPAPTHVEAHPQPSGRRPKFDGYYYTTNRRGHGFWFGGIFFRQRSNLPKKPIWTRDPTKK